MEQEFERVASVFAAARSLDREARAAFLHERCAGDDVLRAEVEALLQAHDAVLASGQPDPFLPPRPDLAAGLLPGGGGAHEPTPQLADYRILGRIADGGMGTVYLAEQSKPRREVALKVLRPEAATPEGRRRFDLEAEVLARLEHPGIARVYAFGTTAGPGLPRPFLSMEFVAGEPLTVAAARLDLPARVALLAEVAEAVAHAHAKGVVHRDLKPDNILVLPDGRPKVVDFGVARLLDDDVMRVTRVGLVIGTLAYMSPEQARGDVARVDTRSDVYALGVVAYEALSGRHPLGDRPGAFSEVVRRIEEEEPPDPGQLDRRLRGDLRLILGKALAKEPERRYASASGLAEDLRRHQRDEPILAQPPTGAYHVRRLLRRHKALVAGAAATLLALVAGLVVAMGLARSERRERLRADANAEAMERALSSRNVEIAASALREHDAATADAALARVPPALRAWEWAYLSNQSDRSVSHLPLDVGPLKAARIGGPDESVLALAEDGTVWVRDPGAGEARRLTLPGSFGQSALARLGGRPVVACREGDTLLVLDATGREVLRGTLASRRALQSAAGSDDGRRLAVTQDGAQSWCPLQVFDGVTGETVLRAAASLVSTVAVALDPAGREVFYAGWSGEVRGQQIQPSAPPPLRLRAHTAEVQTLALSHDGTLLASGARDRTARVWDLAAGGVSRAPFVHSGEVLAVAFSPDDRRLVTATRDAQVVIWDLATGTRERVLIGHHGPVRALRFEGEVLETLGDDGLRRWIPTDHPDVLRHHGVQADGNPIAYVYGVDVAPDGARLASAAWDGSVCVADLATGNLERTLDSGGQELRAVRWSRDGRSIFAGHLRLLRWDAETGAERAARAFPQGLECIARVPSDDTILVGDGAGVVCRLRAEDLEPVETWPGHGGIVYDLAVDAAGRTAAWITGAGHVFVRNLADGTPRWSRAVHRVGRYGAVAFSPDGRWLATAGADHLVRILDPDTGEEVATLRGHQDAVYALAWLPDGSRLVSGSNDGTILLWDPEGGQVRLRLAGHASYVYRLAVSPDGTTIASASGDGSVRLWSTRRRGARGLEAVAGRDGD